MSDRAKHFIVIDGGTQNIKAFVFDENGNEICGESMPVAPYFAPQPGFAEQDAVTYLQIVQRATASVIQKSGISPDSIGGVAITTHRSTIVPVDQKGNPIRSAITWLDRRQTEGLKIPGGPIMSLAFKASRMEERLREYQKRSKFNWLKRHEPQNYARTFKFLTISSYILHSLTGEFRDCSSMIVGLFPIDLKGLQWHPWRIIYEIFGVERDRLPVLVSPVEIAGRVSGEGARRFGIPQGLPVIIGAGDKQSELLGAGATTGGIAEISYGTAAVIEVLSSKYVTHPRMDFFTWGAAIPGHWALEGFVGRGYWMVSWFKSEFGKREEEEALRLGVPPEVVLDRQLTDMPPGSMGLLVQPYWHPRENDALSKGAMIGFSGEHTRRHVYRAIIEGITYELRRLGELMVKHTGTPITELRIGGGGSQSDEIMQITADVFGLPAMRMHTSNLAALGAAIDAAVALGIHKSFPEAVQRMVRIKSTFQPVNEHTKIYDRLFKEVYSKMYSALTPLHHRIAEITNYPKLR